MPVADEEIVRQLSSVVNACTLALSGGEQLDEVDARRLLTRALAAIDRAARPDSPYATQAKSVMEGDGWTGWKARELVAIVEALRDDYFEGAMQRVEELVHAELFGDFLDRAVELHGKGFVGPAAIVAGSVLEEHVRKLATKHKIAVTDDKSRVKSVETLSVELRKADVVTEVQRKSIVAWYAQRNEAAHGHFDALVEPEVERMIEGVRDFVARHSA